MLNTFSEPNFYSFFFSARPSFPAELRIVLTVRLAPLDPSRPYTEGISDAPWPLSETLPPKMRDMIWRPRINTAIKTHIANSPSDIRRGVIKDADGEPFTARSWMKSEFDNYKRTFKRVVELTWNNQIILLPPSDARYGLSDEDYDELIQSPRIPAHVVCTLEIQFVDSSTANAQIRVARLDREPSKQRVLMSRIGEGPFRSYALLLTNEDVERSDTTSYRWPSIRMSQIAAAHEIGHWLGNPTPLTTDRFREHVDTDKPFPADMEKDEAGYGIVPGRRAAIMGTGSLATAFEAEPWLDRIGKHSKGSTGWRFLHRLKFAGQVPVSERQRRIRP
jgi:hypothetical protein